MKLAEELNKIAHTDPMELYYAALERDMRAEAQEGGIHKIVAIADSMYNEVCQHLMDEGFEVMIYNYNAENPSHYVYIVWDSETFHKEFIDDNPNLKDVTLHFGLLAE